MKVNLNILIIISIIILIFILVFRLYRINNNTENFESVEYSKSNTDKIAFLFLTYNNLKRPDIWNKFFDIDNSSNTSKYSNKYNIYLHAKEPEKVTDFILQGKQIPEHIETCWGCANLVEANILMMKEALKDPLNKKFILVSDSCIPIVSFNTFYSEVMKDNKSRIGLISNNTIDRYDNIISPPFPKNEFTKHNGSGNIFNREHSLILISNIEILKNNWINIAAPDEHFNGNILKLLDSNFDNNNINLSTTFDMWHINNLNNSNIDKNVDLTYFNNKVGYSPDIFTKISNKAIDELRSNKFFFVRKIDNNTEINIDYIV